MLKFNKPMTVRVAPSPTGNAHLGTARVAYTNWLVAKSTGGKLIFRSDDTDPERSKPEYEKEILDKMDWLGIHFDEFYRQSERFDIYRSEAERLLSIGRAVEKDGAIYLKPERKLESWNDIVSGEMRITKTQLESVDNLVIVRSNGSPTFHFASAVDDWKMGTDLVMRGTDHIDNTSKTVHICDALGAPLPLFAHVGLIHFKGKKISKRDKESSMDFYKENYHPGTVLNTILKLSWGHPDPQFDKAYPIITMEDAITLFPQGKLKSSPSSLDMNKMDWLEKKYRRR